MLEVLAHLGLSGQHNQSNLHNRNLFLTALEAVNPRSECQQCWCRVSLSLWFVGGGLPLPSLGLPSFCASASYAPFP